MANEKNTSTSAGSSTSAGNQQSASTQKSSSDLSQTVSRGIGRNIEDSTMTMESRTDSIVGGSGRSSRSSLSNDGASSYSTQGGVSSSFSVNQSASAQQMRSTENSVSESLLKSAGEAIAGNFAGGASDSLRNTNTLSDSASSGTAAAAGAATAGPLLEGIGLQRPGMRFKDLTDEFSSGYSSHSAGLSVDGKMGNGIDTSNKTSSYALGKGTSEGPSISGKSEYNGVGGSSGTSSNSSYGTGESISNNRSPLNAGLSAGIKAQGAETESISVGIGRDVTNGNTSSYGRNENASNSFAGLSTGSSGGLKGQAAESDSVSISSGQASSSTYGRSEGVSSGQFNNSIDSQELPSEFVSVSRREEGSKVVDSTELRRDQDGTITLENASRTSEPTSPMGKEIAAYDVRTESISTALTKDGKIIETQETSLSRNSLLPNNVQGISDTQSTAQQSVREATPAEKAAFLEQVASFENSARNVSPEAGAEIEQRYVRIQGGKTEENGVRYNPDGSQAFTVKESVTKDFVTHSRETVTEYGADNRMTTTTRDSTTEHLQGSARNQSSSVSQSQSTSYGVTESIGQAFNQGVQASISQSQGFVSGISQEAVSRGYSMDSTINKAMDISVTNESGASLDARAAAEGTMASKGIASSAANQIERDR